MQLSKKLTYQLKNSEIKPILTHFLSTQEQTFLATQKKVDVVFSNTYPQEERKRAWMNPDTSLLDFSICLLEVTLQDKTEDVSHRDVLGAIMSLSIDREHIGDIIIEDGIYLLIEKEVQHTIMQNLTSIKHTSVHLQEQPLSLLHSMDVNMYQDAQITISSMRLDTIISRIIRSSRTKAQEFIAFKNVKVNGMIQKKPDYILQPNDVISIYKHGRVIIQDIVHTTKKEQLVLQIKKTK